MMKIKELTVYAVLAVILLLGQVALAPLPNIEIVSLLVIVYSTVYRWKTLIILYVFALLEGVLFGFGIWWISYLYVWTILMTLSILLAPVLKDRSFLWAGLAGLFGLAFGSLTAIPYLFTGGPSFAIAYIISGLMFDLLHAGGNLVVTFLLYRLIKSTVVQMNRFAQENVRERL